MSHTDEQLNYWAEEFSRVGLADVMTFEAFMDMSVPMRERRLLQARVAREVQNSVDRAMPDAAMHGDRLVDPFHHGLRKFRRVDRQARASWFQALHRQ